MSLSRTLSLSLAAVFIIFLVIAFANTATKDTDNTNTEIKMQLHANEITSSGKKIITWAYKNTIPEIPDKTIVEEGLELALQKWEETDNIKFIHDQNNPDFEITWKVFEEGYHKGWADCKSYLNRSPYYCNLEITLGGMDCNGNYIQHNKLMVANTVMHEIGHYLGIDHTLDEAHLMHGIDGTPQNNFDDLGYEIPERFPEEYVGRDILLKQYERLGNTIDREEQRLEDLRMQIEVKKAQFDRKYSSHLESGFFEGSDGEYRNYLDDLEKNNHLIRSYNSDAAEHDLRIDRANKLVEKLNCFPNVE